MVSHMYAIAFVAMILDSAVEVSAPRSGERQQAGPASTAEFRMIGVSVSIAGPSAVAGYAG
jgi:hypothetical protein